MGLLKDSGIRATAVENGIFCGCLCLYVSSISDDVLSQKAIWENPLILRGRGMKRQNIFSLLQVMSQSYLWKLFVNICSLTWLHGLFFCLAGFFCILFVCLFWFGGTVGLIKIWKHSWLTESTSDIIGFWLNLSLPTFYFCRQCCCCWCFSSSFNMLIHACWPNNVKLHIGKFWGLPYTICMPAIEAPHLLQYLNLNQILK